MRRQYTFDTGRNSYHLEIDNANPNILSAGSPGRIRRIGTHLKKPNYVKSDRGLVTVHGTYQGLPITAFSTGMGPASVAITLPEIIEACDDDTMNIIRLGTCGGLQEYMNIGDFVITTNVQRAESTSEKIMGEGYQTRADQSIVNGLLKQTQKHKQPYQNILWGKTRTTDDLYFDGLQSQQGVHTDVLAVSMEFSVHCAIRDRYNKDQHRKIAAGNLLVVSDVMVGNAPMDIEEFLARKNDIEQAHIKIGLETLLHLKS